MSNDLRELYPLNTSRRSILNEKHLFLKSFMHALNFHSKVIVLCTEDVKGLRSITDSGTNTFLEKPVSK